MRVDVGHVGAFDSRGVQAQHPLGLVVVDGHSVQGQQTGDDVDITDERNIAQDGRGRAEQSGNHRLGHEVLRPAYRDLPREGASALDLEQSVDHQVPPKRYGRGCRGCLGTPCERSAVSA